MINRYLISVRNIPWTISRYELEKYFSTFGKIKNTKVIFDKNGLSTGHGFVEFYSKLEMNNVLCMNHILEGELLHVTKETKYSFEENIKQFENIQNR